MMATRGISWIRKSSPVNAFIQASFSSHSFSSFKHGQSSFAAAFGVSSSAFSITSAKSMLHPAMGLQQVLHRNLSCSPAFRSVVANQHCKSSMGMGVTQLSQSSHYSSTSGVYSNVKSRFAKQRRNRGEMKGGSGNRICFGKYGLQVLEPAWITSKQILAGQLAIKRTVRGGKSMIRIFPHKPISLKPAETRMGRGKGSTAYWVAGVKPGRILYELNGMPESIARRAITVAASKMPARTQFVKS